MARSKPVHAGLTERGEKHHAGARGGRPPLISRERILEVARQIPARELTMPAVALRLGVSAPALYRHFESRDALLGALGSLLSEEFAIRPADPHRWREWLLDTAVDFYVFLAANPVILTVSGWSHVDRMGQPLLDAAYATLEGAGFDIVEATEIWGLVAGNAYLRARLLHDAPADPEALRRAQTRIDSRHDGNARRWQDFVDARGTTDPRELLVHSVRWLVSTLPEPAAGKARKRRKSA